MVHVNPSGNEIRALVAGAGTIAMVGASSNPARPSHGVMAFLLERGFRVIPVNPNETEVHGRRAWPTLESVPEPVDIVDVCVVIIALSRRKPVVTSDPDDLLRIARALRRRLDVVAI